MSSGWPRRCRGTAAVILSVTLAGTAAVMGVAMKKAGHNGKALAWISGFGVVALLASVWGGQFLHGTELEKTLTLHGTTLAWWIMGYGFLASVLPVWLLLAPRDYLSAFIKIGTVGLLAAGLLIGEPRREVRLRIRRVHGEVGLFERAHVEGGQAITRLAGQACHAGFMKRR